MKNKIFLKKAGFSQMTSNLHIKKNPLRFFNRDEKIRAF